MTLKPMTPIITDNERLLLKAAKDVVMTMGNTDLAKMHEFGDALLRLRRAVEIVEARETVAKVPMEEK